MALPKFLAEKCGVREKLILKSPIETALLRKIRFPSCFLFADNYTEIRFISHHYPMLTKRQLFLILFAVLAVIAAGATLFWMKKMDQMFQNPMPGAAEPSIEITMPTNNEEASLDPLQEDFDNLLSGEGVAEMYEGEKNYGFTATGDQF